MTLRTSCAVLVTVLTRVLQFPHAVMRKCVYGAVGLSLSLCTSSLATAATTVKITDTTNTIFGNFDNVFIISASGTDEGPGIIGALNVTFTYTDSTPPAVGSHSTTNYNIFEPGGVVLSDTLHIDVSGIAPTANGNVQVVFNFRSDSADEISPLALIDAITLIETGQMQTVPTIFGGVSDLTVQFQSDLEVTPLPAATFRYRPRRLRAARLAQE